MRKKLLTAAVSIFSKKGFYKATMDEIALEAGVAKGTLYYHFENKAELFKTVILEGVNDLKDDLIETIKNYDAQGENLIKVVVKRNIEYYLKFHELTHIVLNEITNGIDDETLKEIENAKDIYMNFLTDILTKDYNKDTIYLTNFNLITSGIIGMIDGICRYYLKNDEIKSTVAENDMITYATNVIAKMITNILSL